MKTRTNRGAALVTVLVFALVFSVIGLAFLQLAAYEVGATIYRDSSSTAFFAADAGIEAAKGRIFQDGTWRDGFPEPGDPCGDGRYVLTITDSLYRGEPASILRSSGYVKNARRNVEVFGQIVQAAFFEGIWAKDQIKLGGNAKIDGHAHADGCFSKNTGSPGSTTPCYTDEEMLALRNCVDGNCGDQFSHGYLITPPKAYTEPDSFPGATYYYVRATDVGGPLAEILDRNRQSFVPKRTVPVTLKSGHYFYRPNPGNFSQVGPYSAAGSWFPLDTARGDRTVIANFGEMANGHGDVADIDIVNGGGPVIASTLINARFTGISKSDRLDPRFWQGGELVVKTDARFEPENGVTMIVKDLRRANATVALGTRGGCGLTYVTGNVFLGNGSATIEGTLICLTSVELTGTLVARWNPCFIQKGPPWVRFVGEGTSGLFQVLLWRETP